eukprot:TRINITY_DN7978_c0_g1_i2.p1 TRINITY_DN7978_c0_g1~~TRINITY_DN7978_c0_g1_i2.p1  ORF type:complete len:131 (-),score=4.80 TRINITY_DN7978_c0_g1_i2:203-595(-)
MSFAPSFSAATMCKRHTVRTCCVGCKLLHSFGNLLRNCYICDYTSHEHLDIPSAAFSAASMAVVVVDTTASSPAGIFTGSLYSAGRSMFSAMLSARGPSCVSDGRITSERCMFELKNEKCITIALIHAGT